MKDPTLYVLTGPTASGKTAAAIAWALAHEAEILSCDALLVYRHMDIGTAKPTAQEQARVPHHLIDVAAVRQGFDITAYVRTAQEAVRSIHARGKRVLVVGGSGFYLKSFFAPVADVVVIPEAVRYEVQEALQSGGLPRLVAWLKELQGPSGLPQGFDAHNPRRVVRGLERCLATGHTLRALQEAFAALPCAFSGYPKKTAVLAPPAEVLQRRIRERAWVMLQVGFIEEVKRLLEEGLESNPSAARAVGYRQVIAWLQDPHRGSLEQLHGAIVQATNQLVRKQRTWFAHQLPAQRVTLSCAEAFCHYRPQE